MTQPTITPPRDTTGKSGPKPQGGARFPGGKLRPAKAAIAPVLIRRMIDAARAGASDPLLATPIGWLLLQRRLNPVQVAAAQAYSRARAAYDEAIDAPARTSASPSYGAIHVRENAGRGPAEDSARAVKAKRRFKEIVDCFPVRQSRIVALLDRTCIENAHPALFEQSELASALSRLAVHFRLAGDIRAL